MQVARNNSKLRKKYFCLKPFKANFSKHDIFYLQAIMRIVVPVVRNLGFLDSENFMIKFSFVKDLVEVLI